MDVVEEEVIAPHRHRLVKVLSLLIVFAMDLDIIILYCYIDAKDGPVMKSWLVYSGSM